MGKKGKHPIEDKKGFNFFNMTIFLVMFIFFLLTIGFSSLYSSFDIGDVKAIVRINKDIRITGISLDNTTGSAISNWQEYSTHVISTSISLPSSSSSITYEVEITNIGNIEMGIFDIIGLPNNLAYSISGYTMKDELCDYNNSSSCKLGSVSKIYITFSYDNNGFDPNNTDYNIILDFDFRRFYSITYVNLNSNNLPNKAIEGDDLTFTLNSPIPPRVHFTGNSGALYNSSTGVVSLIDIDDDVIISYVTRSYFLSFDSSLGYLFGLFDKTNITSFSRNTSLTLNQVQTMVNNGTAYKISTSYNDPDYPSDYDVYGYVDNNHFYWWSESNVVYFHPYTLGAFRNMLSLTSVDLTGTSTAAVRNFAHFFDKDEYLTTISGTIDTSGLVLEYNNNFDYGADRDENASGGTGLAFMFNDCKRLTSIDLTYFNTTNAGDMKRMFGGCNSLRSLDVSGFDTSNVKSMYWMFRKNEGLTSIDVRNFNTSNVVNMFGMFVNASATRTVYLGTGFNTRNVQRFNYMFGNMYNLNTIYAYSDFDLYSKVDSANMFSQDTRLVGSANTFDETIFDTHYTDSRYARLAYNGVNGYFTPYAIANYYTITYDVDGGTNENPTLYDENTPTFTLMAPRKPGYEFIGWTGSNGNIPELNVTIPTGSSGNRTYVAHYQVPVVDLFPKVFSVSGSCNFNGSNANITGSTCVSDIDGTDYTTSTYIDTGINLYNSENLYKDYEIYFELSNYNPANQETMANGNKQNTFMNSKAESSGYPGVVIRRNNDLIEIKSFNNSTTTSYRNVTSIKIVRMNRKIYYSVNGAGLTLLHDNTSYTTPFNLSVVFGSSIDGSGQPFRHVKCTMSNFYVKLGTYS